MKLGRLPQEPLAHSGQGIDLLQFIEATEVPSSPLKP